MKIVSFILSFILLFLLTDCAAVAASESDSLTAGPVAGYVAGERQQKVYVMTATGVDNLQLGKRLVKQPKAGSFYDRVRFESQDECGQKYYTLYAKNKAIGTVITSVENKVEQIVSISVTGNNVRLENGLAVGMSIGEAIASGKVSAFMDYNFAEGGVDMSVAVVGVEIALVYDYDILSDAGGALSSQLEKRSNDDPSTYTKKRPDGSEEITLKTSMDASHFKADAVIKGFSVGHGITCYGDGYYD